MVSGTRGTLRSGYGILYERQPLACTIHVYTGGLDGCPACYASVRLDVVVVYNDNAEYQRLHVYTAAIPEAVREPSVEALLPTDYFDSRTNAGGSGKLRTSFVLYDLFYCESWYLD